METNIVLRHCFLEVLETSHSLRSFRLRIIMDMKLRNIKNGKSGLFSPFVFEFKVPNSYKVLCTYTMSNGKSYKIS